MSFLLDSEKIVFLESFTFDDLLLLPDYADFDRTEVDLSTELHAKLKLRIPVISSPMDTVTMSEMAINLASYGGLGIIHRNLEIKEQITEIKKVKNAKIKNPQKASLDSSGRLLVGAAVGISLDFEEKIKKLIAAEVDVLVIDSAHGHTKFIINLIKKIKKISPKIPVIGGNVATKEGAKDLIEAGVDIIRVGMGPGSICTTRVVTGVGVPQLTAVGEVVSVAKNTKVKVIADGGIKQIGDIAKALGVGADCVMLGSMLAGFRESPGETIEIEGKAYKSYRGMGSVKAMRKGAASRYGQDFDAKKLVAEGVEGMVKFKGSVEEFLYQLEGGLRSSFYYCGSKNLEIFQNKTRFLKISGNGLKESHPHTIAIKNQGDSYLSDKVV